MGELLADAGKFRDIEFLPEALAPVGIEKEVVSRFKGVRKRAEVFHGENLAGPGFREADDVGGSETGFEGSLVDEFFSTVEMPRGVHMGSAVGVEMVNTRIPSPVLRGFDRLEGDPGQILADGAGEIDEHGEESEQPGAEGQRELL